MLVWPSVPPEFCKDGAKLILGLQTVNTCLKKNKQTKQHSFCWWLVWMTFLAFVFISWVGVDYCIKKGGKKGASIPERIVACGWIMCSSLSTLSVHSHTVFKQLNHITWAREQTARCSAGPSLSFKLSLRCVIMLIIVRKGSNWLAASCSAFWALWREVRPALAVGPLWLEHDFAVWSFQTGPVSEWPGRMARTVIFHVYFLECDASTEA